MSVIVRRRPKSPLPDSGYFATCARGLEEVLAGELRRLELPEVQAERGGVRFGGGIAGLYRACLWLRTASRVLVPLASFPCTTPEELYQGVRAIPWEQYLTPEQTLAVECSLRDSALTHSGFVALKSKDAIVDCLRDHFGRRPNVDPKDPDLRINLHLVKNRCTVSLDASGAPLDRRGYRLDRAVAPLRETLAAAVVLLSGWPGDTPLVDPLCGSGTLVIEAALLATDRAPGLQRPMGFQRWPAFDRPLWNRLLEEARQRQRPTLPFPLLGSDRDLNALRSARANAERAGVASLVDFGRRELADFTPPPGSGWLVTNPPYGERLAEVESLRPFYRQLGDLLKQRCAGWQAAVLTGSQELAKEVGLRPRQRIPLWNGPLECRLLLYALY